MLKKKIEFNKKGLKCGINFYSHKKLENVQEYKYLGITFTSNGSMTRNTARENIYKKASQALFLTDGMCKTNECEPQVSSQTF